MITFTSPATSVRQGGKTGSDRGRELLARRQSLLLSRASTHPILPLCAMTRGLSALHPSRKSGFLDASARAMSSGLQVVNQQEDGFDFTDTGAPEGVRGVGKMREGVVEVHFKTGVPEPRIKSPLDRHTLEKQMVAETVVAYGCDFWFDEPERTDESDNLFVDYDPSVIDDLFASPEPAVKPEPSKTKGAAAADIFDDCFDQKPRSLPISNGTSDRGCVHLSDCERCTHSAEGIAIAATAVSLCTPSTECDCIVFTLWMLKMGFHDPWRRGSVRAATDIGWPGGSPSRNRARPFSLRFTSCAFQQGQGPSGKLQL